MNAEQTAEAPFAARRPPKSYGPITARAANRSAFMRGALGCLLACLLSFTNSAVASPGDCCYENGFVPEYHVPASEFEDFAIEVS